MDFLKFFLQIKYRLREKIKVQVREERILK